MSAGGVLPSVAVGGAASYGAGGLLQPQPQPQPQPQAGSEAGVRWRRFVVKLLGSQARLLSMEPEQKVGRLARGLPAGRASPACRGTTPPLGPPTAQGAYRAGADAPFRGKISYRHCRQPVWPPSNWDGSLAARSARLPRAGLELQHVYG